jgi:hypothetical protein
MTAEDWGLYTGSYPEETYQVAIVLNFTFEGAVNAGLTKEEVAAKMVNVMEANSMYGANDSEAYAALTYALDYVFK